MLSSIFYLPCINFRGPHFDWERPGLGDLVMSRILFFLSEPIIVIDFLRNFLQRLTPFKNFFVPIFFLYPNDCLTALGYY